ncbi:MAG: hypothetical protein KJP21_08845 [Bacteroidia bacterium]|nr:hypothetical protein [Bacteroidia bacterium]NNJ55653.1 hypothetical protein [Bacteroidia bacterium]
MYLTVLLSSAIPSQELAVRFIRDALPQAQEIYCISKLTNDAIHVETEQGEYTKKTPPTLGSFIEKATTGWYAKSETPFSNSKQLGQTLLEMELDRDFLFLKGIQSEDAMLFFLIQFKPFGLSKNKHLMAGEKKLLEHCVRGFLSAILSQKESDKTILQQLAKSNELIKSEVHTYKQQLDYQSKNFEIAVTQFIQLIVNKLQTKYGVTIRLSKAFIEDLKNYNQSFEQLEENLEKHVQIELNLALIQGESKITLTPTHLKDLSRTKPKVLSQTDEDNPLNLGRYAKTYKLLSRYEHAAEAAKQQGLSIIGKNIGIACTPSVSNASITDALNKHAKKIFELFSRYPDNWPIIRTEFRSVANIIEKESIRRQNIA